MNSNPSDEKKQVRREVRWFISNVFWAFLCLGLGLSGAALSAVHPEYLFGFGRFLSIVTIVIGAGLARWAAASLVLIINFKH